MVRRVVLADSQTNIPVHGSIDDKVKEWGLLKKSAVYLLFLAGEPCESICYLLRCTPERLYQEFPSPPAMADKSIYDAFEVLQLFCGDHVLTDLELISDTCHPDEKFRLKTVSNKNGFRLFEGEELRAYFRRKACRNLGYTNEEGEYYR